MKIKSELLQEWNELGKNDIDNKEGSTCYFKKAVEDFADRVEVYSKIFTPRYIFDNFGNSIEAQYNQVWHHNGFSWGTTSTLLYRYWADEFADVFCEWRWPVEKRS